MSRPLNDTFFSNSLVEIRDHLDFDEGGKLKLMGSASHRGLSLASADIDLWQMVAEGEIGELAGHIQECWGMIQTRPDMWYGDFKIAYEDDQAKPDLHWRSLKVALEKSKAEVEDSLEEAEFAKQDISTRRQTVEEELMSDWLKYRSEGRYYKSLKRLMSLKQLQGRSKDVEAITAKLLEPPRPLLYKSISRLELCLEPAVKGLAIAKMVADNVKQDLSQLPSSVVSKRTLVDLKKGRVSKVIETLRRQLNEGLGAPRT